MPIENPRIINTPFYSNKAKEVLSSVLGQMSDGIWENSGRMNKYWRFAEIKVAPNNRVYIEIENVSGKSNYDHRWTENGFSRMTDEEVLQFFANKVKYIMQLELKDDNITDGWKRDNTEFMSSYLNYHEDISVAEVYCIYDILKGRMLSFSACIINNVIGEILSDTETQKEVQRREAKNKIEQEYSVTLKTLNDQKDIAIKEIETKFMALRKEAYDKRDEQIKVIDTRV